MATPQIRNSARVALASLFGAHDSALTEEVHQDLLELLFGGVLSPEDAATTLLALAAALRNYRLVGYAEDWTHRLGLADQEIQEAQEAPASIAKLDTYFGYLQTMGADELGPPANHHMTMPRERFALLTFALAVLAGHHEAIALHANTLRRGGVPALKVNAVARLVAAVKAADQIMAT